MKSSPRHFLALLALLALSTLSPQLSTAFAQGTAFTYQGRLNNNGALANGSYDLQLAIFDAATGGFQIGGTLTTNAVAVSNGLFTITLDFGAGVFTGANRWLNLAVKTNGAVSFTPLTPPQQITAAPYAIAAGTVTGVIPAASLSGLYPGPVTMNNPGNVFNGALFAGVFTGNGAGLTGVNASALGGLSSAGFWKTNGNTGANPTNGAFLGTTDDLPLEFRVNGARALRLEPTADATEVNVIGGSYGNRVISGAVGATVWGGGFEGTNNHGNTVAGAFGTVSGGRQNSANNAETTVAGGRANAANGSNSTVSGGYANTASGAYASIAGGEFNLVTNADYAVIGGGLQNTVQTNASFATIGGGKFNQAAVNEATVAGGAFNSALAFSSTIGGGGGNAASGEWSTISGGRANLLTGADYATIGGGYQNTIQANSPNATIAGGYNNTIQTNSPYATIAGGYNNTIQTNAVTSAIAGGHDNMIQSAAHSAIAGGGFNTIQSNAHDSVIGGGGYNTIQTNANSSFIGGGGVNLIQSDATYSTIGGGVQNTIQSNAVYATIGGGGGNTIQASGYFATIPGGRYNSATNYAFAAGNRAKANHPGAFVWADSTDLDFASTADNQFLIRAGGGVGINRNNPATALDVNGTVTATGFSGSGAGLTGLNAASLSGSVPSASLTSIPAANLAGTILDARLSTNVALRSGGNTFTGNQTITGGSIGIGITPQSTLDVNGTARIDGANNWNVTGGEGDFRVGNDSFRFKIGVANGGGGAGDVWMRAHGGTARVFIKTPGGTTFYSNEGETAGVSLAAGGTAWAVVSDRNVKKDFAPVNRVRILEKLAAMPITQWHYQWETADVTPHIGPMAQDFKAAFYPGTDDKSITTQEADGVALAAIQGLNEKVEVRMQKAEVRSSRLEEELEQKEAEIQGLKAKSGRVDALEKRLNELEQMVESLVANK